MPQIVAAFDFDGTLTQGDTLLPYLRRSLGWRRFSAALLGSAPWLAAYACRLVSNERAKARLLHLSFAGCSVAQMQACSDDFVTHYLPKQWQPWALEKLREHQRAGHRCVLVSASPDIYLRNVAQALGFDALICTELHVQSEHYTGQFATPNCYGEQKAQRLQAWLGAEPVILHAYGDTPGDLPLLRLAQHAWYRGQPWPQSL